MPRAFCTLVARRLGLSPAEASVLLSGMRRAVGPATFAFRGTAFAVAASRPGRRLPAALRRRAFVGFAGPLLESPAALNAYGAGREWRLGDPCAGLVRPD